MAKAQIWKKLLSSKVAAAPAPKKAPAKAKPAPKSKKAPAKKAKKDDK